MHFKTTTQDYTQQIFQINFRKRSDFILENEGYKKIKLKQLIKKGLNIDELLKKLI